MGEHRSDIVAPLRAVLEKESPPELVHKWDEEKRPPLDLLRKLGELGYLSVGLPAEWDGQGDLVDIVAMMEEIAYHNLALGHLVGRTIYIEQLLLRHGTAEQQKQWLPGLRAGEHVFSVGITEPQSGSDAASLALRAVRDGDSYVLNGQKVFSSSMEYAAVAMIAARLDTSPGGREGVTTFLVDPRSEGIECRKLSMVGDWGIGTYEVFYDDVRVPVDNVLGAIEGGWDVLTGHLVRERLIMSARAIGATKRCLDVISRYVSERVQFGKPLADKQVVQHKLADIAISHFLAQSGLYRLADQQQPSRDDAAKLKTFSAEMYVHAACEAMQLSGGYGYTHEFEIQRHFRDSRLYPVGGGSSEVLRDIIARGVLKPFREA